MEEGKTENKKRKKGVIIVVLLIVAICIGGFVYINKDKLFSKKIEPESSVKEEPKEEEEPVEEEEPAVTSNTNEDKNASKYIDQLLVGMHCNRIELFTNNKKVLASDIDAETAYEIALSNASDVFKNDEVTVEEASRAVQKYLGKDYKLDVSKITASKDTCVSHYYDKKLNKFISQETACGGSCGPQTTYKKVKEEENNGVLKIYVKVVFIDKNLTNFYSDFNKTKLIGKAPEDGNIESYFDKGSDYQFTFRNEDGNYVFVSSEPIK